MSIMPAVSAVLKDRKKIRMGCVVGQPWWLAIAEWGFDPQHHAWYSAVDRSAFGRHVELLGHDGVRQCNPCSKHCSAKLLLALIILQSLGSLGELLSNGLTYSHGVELNCAVPISAVGNTDARNRTWLRTSYQLGTSCLANLRAIATVMLVLLS